MGVEDLLYHWDVHLQAEDGDSSPFGSKFGRKGLADRKAKRRASLKLAEFSAVLTYIAHLGGKIETRRTREQFTDERVVCAVQV